MSRSAVLLMLLLATYTGCSSVEKKGSDQFLKPLSSGLNNQLFGGKPDERNLCIETAAAVSKNGHAPEAIQLYERAETLDPKASALDLELAPLYAQTGQTEKAINRYQTVIAKGNATSEVYNNFAWTLIESGRHTAAESVIEQGLGAHPADERLRSARAYVLYELGDREKALKQFAELYGRAAAHHNLAVIDLERGLFDSALAQLTIASQIPECTPETLSLRRTLVAQMTSAKGGPVDVASKRSATR